MVIKELRPLRNELSPDIALREVWETLDQTYYSPTSQVQSLLKKLTQGPDVRAEDATALLTFMLQCQSALALHHHKPIASLEDHTTMDAVVGRLNKVLRREWLTHLRCLLATPTCQPIYAKKCIWSSLATWKWIISNWKSVFFRIFFKFQGQINDVSIFFTWNLLSGYLKKMIFCIYG